MSIILSLKFMDILTAGEDRIKSFVNSLVFFLFFHWLYLYWVISGVTLVMNNTACLWPGWLARLHLWLRGKGEDETVALYAACVGA